MALESQLTLWLAELELGEDLRAAVQLLDPERLWMGSNAETLASRVADHLQSKKLDQGEVQDVVLGLPELGLVEVEPLEVTLGSYRGRRAPLRLRFEAALAETASGLWIGVVPVLGATACGADRAACSLALKARISASVGFLKALQDPTTLLATQRAHKLQVLPQAMNLEFRTASELRDIASRPRPILPRVAQRRWVSRPACFGMDKELDALRRACRSRTARGVLLIGPHGVGKSALLDELLRPSQGRVGEGEVWEAAPGQLLLDLMQDGAGWQQPLAQALGELHAAKGWLRITRLAELFEVGRYEGNPSSIGELLRTPLQRGELRVLSEATPEELARVEARYPGWLDGLTRVVVPAPLDRLEDIVRAWVAEMGQGAQVHGEAIAELLRLQRRFTPHAGFPGRTLRFLDALLRSRRGQPGPVEIQRDDVVARFCEETGLLRALIDPRAPLPLEQLNQFFEQRIYGQPHAVKALVSAIASMKADVARHGKPLASFLLVGPTGVGKTETARALAELLFGSRERLLRFDMSEYGSPQAVMRLVGGAADGEGEGALTGALRREPFSVLLFDEVEKAHPSFLDLLLQVLGEGRLTDDAGRVADFNACVVLLTSNVGGADAQRAPSGFVGEAVERRLAGHFDRAVSAWLRPELRNRLDQVLPYAPLRDEAVSRVLDRELATLGRRVGLDGVSLSLAPEARQALVTRGYDPAWGGRQMIRAVEEGLVFPLARALARKRSGLVQVTQGPQGLLAQSQTDKAPSPPADDGALDRAMGQHRELRALLGSRAFAQLDGLAHRGKAKKGQTQASPERLLLDQLHALEAEALALLLEAGSSALVGEGGVDLRARQDTLDLRLREGLRALHSRLHPADDFCVVGIYGRNTVLLPELLGHLRELCKALGLEAEIAALYPDRDKLEVVEPWTRPRPPDLGECVGYELFVSGPAAAVALADEARLVEYTGRPWAKPQRLRVVVEVMAALKGKPIDARHQLSRTRWAEARPVDLLRQAFYQGRAGRVLHEGALTDLNDAGKTELSVPSPWLLHLPPLRVVALKGKLLGALD